MLVPSSDKSANPMYWDGPGSHYIVHKDMERNMNVALLDCQTALQRSQMDQPQVEAVDCLEIEARYAETVETLMQNLLDCIRSRKQPNCTVEIAAAAVEGPHMANLSMREDRKVHRA